MSPDHSGSGPRIVLTILGCGSSGGVPRIGGHWGAADPKNPKNRRRRCCALVERIAPDGATTTVLIDTSPDIREQLLDAGTERLDAVLYTHDHADQTHGIDDLRMIAINMWKRVPVYMDTPTTETLLARFGYCFETPPGSDYPPILERRSIDDPYAEIVVEGPGGPLRFQSFDQDHGSIRSLGFKVGPFAYSSDLVDLPERSFEILNGVPCWIVDALRYRPHPTHANVERALAWIERVGAKRAVLTNMHVDIDFDTIARETPDHVEPAYDMMRLDYPYTDE